MAVFLLNIRRPEIFNEMCSYYPYLYDLARKKAELLQNNIKLSLFSVIVNEEFKNELYGLILNIPAT